MSQTPIPLNRRDPIDIGKNSSTSVGHDARVGHRASGKVVAWPVERGSPIYRLA